MLVKDPAGVNQGEDSDDRENKDQRILFFNVGHDESVLREPLRLIAVARLHFDGEYPGYQVR